jgi:hypothetical protein
MHLGPCPIEANQSKPTARCPGTSLPKLTNIHPALRSVSSPTSQLSLLPLPYTQRTKDLYHLASIRLLAYQTSSTELSSWISDAKFQVLQPNCVDPGRFSSAPTQEFRNNSRISARSPSATSHRPRRHFKTRHTFDTILSLFPTRTKPVLFRVTPKGSHCRYPLFLQRRSHDLRSHYSLFDNGDSYLCPSCRWCKPLQVSRF